MKSHSHIAIPLFVCFLTSVSLRSSSQTGNAKFSHLSTDEGLSQNHVSAILKDHKGFMWFATDEGLNRYDGYHFVVYKNDAGKATTIGSNNVYALIEDNTGSLWVGMAGGLDKFDRERNVFTHYQPGINATVRNIFQDGKNRIWLGTTEGLFLVNPATGVCRSYCFNDGNATGMPAANIYQITGDDDGQLWIATQDGLHRFNPESGAVLHFKNHANDSKSIGANVVKTVFKDSRGNIWAGTQGSGIALFDRVKNTFTHYRHDAGDQKSISHNDILSFAESNDGRLWVGTENGGISVFDYGTKTFTAYQNNENDNSSLSNNSVYCLYKDNIGNMWAGTWSGGVNLLPRYGDKFRLYKQIAADKKSLSNNIILSILGDKAGEIWIGTDGGGLNRFDPVKQSFSHYLHNDNNKNSPGSDYVLSIVEAAPGLLGIGYHRGGFDLLNTVTGVFTHHLPAKNPSSNEAVLSVNVVWKDNTGGLWLGTWGGGLELYDIKTKKSTLYQNIPGDSNSISSNFIHSILVDGQGKILIGTGMGLDVLDRTSGLFTHYINHPGEKQSLGNNMVESMLEDHAGKVWIGTAGGLNLFNSSNGTFTAYTEKDGLANNMVSGMLEDGAGNIWISSNHGLTRFNPKSKVCRIYNTADGLQSNAFKARSVYKSPSGEMFFGGTNGFNVFHPDSLHDNDFIPPIVLTGLQVFNNSVSAGDNSGILEHDISETKEINLSYTQSVFTFEFTALNYTLPQENKYVYRLEGFDEEWTHASDKRAATYTNLDGGEYTFRVKGSNNDGLWNTSGVSVKVIIIPPWWRRLWFKLAILFGISGGAIAFYFYRMNIVESQKKELQRLVNEQTGQLVQVNSAERKARLEAEKSRHEADKANKAKSTFLATMSHEIRTPMNGVIGMATLLGQTELTVEQKGYVGSINSCGESLLNVINDILDFSKIESGKIELEYRDFDLRTCIEELLEIFAAKAVQTGLELMYEIDSSVPAQIKGDSSRIRQVLMNLISNAVKFTHSGEVLVKVHPVCATATGELEISFEVQDTGIGIAPDKMKHLFKSFSQVDSSINRKYGGTGLGLVICEKLIGLMGGRITASSEPGKGTVFAFTIKSAPGENAKPAYTECSMSGLRGKRVLVVDDNQTCCRILQSQLLQWNMVPVVANSCSEALALIGDGFDLVLTDLQMPAMDGIQFAEQIRKNYPGVPVVLLSAAGENWIKDYPGLFDAVLTKPIRQQALSRTVLQIFQQSPVGPVQQEQISKHILSADFARQYPLRLLVAEDNFINQELMMKILGNLGYEPTLVENGLQVLELTQIDNFDIILMDVQMPEMDGLETTRHIRTNQLSQPIIIAMTANAMQGDQDECLQVGMNDYLSKPVVLNDLLNMLIKWAGVINKQRDVGNAMLLQSDEIDTMQ